MIVRLNVAMVVAADFSRGNINYLVDKGMIEKSARGVYILPEVWGDEIFNLQNRFKRGIYSHDPVAADEMQKWRLSISQKPPF